MDQDGQKVPAKVLPNLPDMSCPSFMEVLAYQSKAIGASGLLGRRLLWKCKKSRYPPQNQMQSNTPPSPCIRLQNARQQQGTTTKP